MEAYFLEWLNLLLRWAHFITGVAWIGASFYFNWLENHLERQNAKGGIAGDLWAVHGGGFYYLQKFTVAPERLPANLHWFKWEAYFTWITGFILLCTLYYWNAGVFMVDSRVADLSSLQAVGIGIASLVLSWLFYDGLCRSPLARKQALTALLIFAWFALLSWLLSQFLSGRAAYIHVGAAIGTIMVANVFFVIIPSQKDLVEAVNEQRMPDPQKGKNALARSRHNNYFTLPVLFIMISSHYAGTFGHPLNWLVLLVISMVGVGIRHWFNIRHLEKHGPLGLLQSPKQIFNDRLRLFRHAIWMDPGTTLSTRFKQQACIADLQRRIDRLGQIPDGQQGNGQAGKRFHLHTRFLRNLGHTKQFH